MVESISKTPVDRDQAAAVVDAAFGGAAALVAFEECTEGWFNAVYRLGLSDGTGCILKVAPPPGVRVLRYEHDLVTTEVDALRLVRERTKLPVPAVLAWDRSCTLLPSPYFLMEECRGVLFSTRRAGLEADRQRRVDAQLAHFLAEMNAITASEFGRPDATATRHATWSAAFGRLVHDLLADGAEAGVVLPRPYEAFAAIVEERAECLDAARTPRLVHWDLWDNNVFVDPDTLAVVGLIDFERVLWGDPLMEAQFVGRRAHDDMVDDYGTRLFDEPHAVARRRLYDLYLYLVMTVECAYRNYPTGEIEEVGRSCLAAVLDEIDAG